MVFCAQPIAQMIENLSVELRQAIGKMVRCLASTLRSTASIKLSAVELSFRKFGRKPTGTNSLEKPKDDQKQ